MRAFSIFPALIALSACGGQSNDTPLENAAEQSDPAAAAVLENAARNGIDPQNALELAGNAQAPQPADQSLQARPNTAADPNPAGAGQAPEKVAAGNDAAEDHSAH